MRRGGLHRLFRCCGMIAALLVAADSPANCLIKVISFSSRAGITLYEGTSVVVGAVINCDLDGCAQTSCADDKVCEKSFHFPLTMTGNIGERITTPADLTTAAVGGQSWTLSCPAIPGNQGVRSGTIHIEGGQGTPCSGSTIPTPVHDLPVYVVDTEAFSVGVAVNVEGQRYTGGVVLEGRTATLDFYRLGNSADMFVPIRVYYVIDAASTASSTDHNLASGYVDIPANSTSKQVTVKALADALDEGNETIVVKLTSSNIFPINNQTATLTIVDDTANVNVEFLPTSSQTEGHQSFLRFWRSPFYASSTKVDINFSLAGSTAVNGLDYERTTGAPLLANKATIDAGKGEAIIPLDILSDDVVEATEQLKVNITPGLYTIDTPSATLDIKDNTSTVSVEFLQPYVREGETATLRFYRKVSNNGLNGIPELPVKISLQDSTAVATGGKPDYAPPLGNTITFPEGALEVRTNITTIFDSTTLTEGNEIVKVTLKPTSPGTYRLVDHTNTTLTIVNNTPIVSVAGISTNASESGKTAVFSISRFGDSRTELKVPYQLTGTAINGVDYSYLSNAIVIPAGESYAQVTVVPIYDQLTEGTENVILTLVDTADYNLGSSISATNFISDYSDSSREAPPDEPGGGLSPQATYARFTRSPARSDVIPQPAYQSIVVPVEFEKGVPLGLTGSNGAALFPGISWGTLYHFDFDAFTNGVPTNSLAFQNPIVAFGSRVGGSPLYFDRTYTFGIYSGDPIPLYTNAAVLADALRIQVYDQATFAFVGTTSISIPDPANPNEWLDFVTNGYSKTVSGYGLTTTVSFQNRDWVWGTEPELFGNLDAACHLTHQADSANPNRYIYMVEFAGGTEFEWMVTDSHTNRAWSRLYTMEFERRPAWRMQLVGQPQFFGEPMPPGYAGRSAEEFLTNGAPVTNLVYVPDAPVTYTNLDLSPELRMHPALDKLVADLGNDPIQLANYVLNEIELVDGFGYNDNGPATNVSINLGGVNRGALGTFLEGQGSPTEQCALLIYLLRRAGVPAVYLFPPTNGLKMVDARMSKLLHMQIRGAVNNRGEVYTTNSLIPVNYPWVGAYLTNEARWVHLFPWLKDTEVEEGLDLYDYMPPQYDNAFKWGKAFMYGDTNLLALSPDDDSPLVIYPRFLEKTLRETAPGISVDDLGVKVRNRRHYYSRWSDFPTPTSVVSSNIPVESLGSSSITNVHPLMTNIFNTVSIEVSSDHDSSKKVFSGELRMAEIHNRRLVAWHEKVGAAHKLHLSLAPFRPQTAATKAFAAANLLVGADTNILFNLTTNVTLSATDTSLSMKLVHRRSRTLPDNFSRPDPWLVYPGYLTGTTVTNVRPFTKGDLAAIPISVGRVTRKMLDQHANEIWQMEQAGTTGNDTFRYQGSIAYLMGMSYYEKTSRWGEMIARLHKVQPLTGLHSGLSLIHAHHDAFGELPDGNIYLVQPAVDMFFQERGVVGNQSLHLNSGDDGFNGDERVFELTIVGDSALEHWTLNHFFKESDSVSTVKLLRLAQRNSSVVLLTHANYLAEGEKEYPADSGVKLKDADPGSWATITHTFTSSSDYWKPQVYMTPGKIRNNSGSYYGVGAMVFSPVGSSRVDLQACKLEYSIVSPK